MPFIVRCSKCGYLFYYSSNVSPLTEVLNSLQSSCPRCGKTLNKELRDIKIVILPVTIKNKSKDDT